WRKCDEPELQEQLTAMASEWVERAKAEGAPRLAQVARSRFRLVFCGRGLYCHFMINPAHIVKPLAKVPAFHSKREGFYHDTSQCGLGGMISLHNRIQGTGEKPLCKNCAKLQYQEA